MYDEVVQTTLVLPVKEALTADKEQPSLVAAKLGLGGSNAQRSFPSREIVIILSYFEVLISM